MRRQDLQRAADPATYVTGLAATAPSAHGGHRSHEVIRTDIYNGHAIEIRTAYTITVDGEPVTAHMHVDNDGNVICHAIPVYRSASMVNVVRRLIDLFPDDFPIPPPLKTKKSAVHPRRNAGGVR